MTRDEIQNLADRFVDESPLNRIEPLVANGEEPGGITMYDRPLLGVAMATDPYFEVLSRPEAIGVHFRPPREWLDAAASVVAVFLPLSDRVIASNRKDPAIPSPEWLYARIEGQEFIDALCRRLTEALETAGHQAVAPSLHSDFRSWAGPGEDGIAFTSNWSERHVAHVAGLGTFGISSGLITRRGMAGRMASVVTTLPLAADTRPYASHDEYCTRCGACMRRCLAGSISLEKGRDKMACAVHLQKMLARFAPRYGCGKCQVAVPCERRIPGR